MVTEVVTVYALISLSVAKLVTYIQTSNVLLSTVMASKLFIYIFFS